MKLLKRFERLVLIPLDFAIGICAVLQFIRGNWIVGVVLLLLYFFVGIIGQSLHKDLTTAQLAKGEHLIDREEANANEETLSPLDANLLGKALIQTTVLLLLMFIFSAIGSGLSLWVILLVSIGIIFLAPLLISIFIMFPEIIKGFNKRK